MTTRQQLNEAFRARRAATYRALGLPRKATPDQIHAALIRETR